MELELDRRKLDQTVIGILKSANLDIATELSVRNDAEKLLGVDLSDLSSKQQVRQIVESFLLSTYPADELREETEAANELRNEKLPVNDRNNASDDSAGRIICRLPGMKTLKTVSIKNSRGTKLVSIREYHEKQGRVLPTKKEITLNPKEWSAFRSSFSEIEEAITKMESRMRGEESIVKKQTEPESSNPSTSLPSQPLVPISTTRFTGKNHYCWKRQMEFYLNQLNISYVLVKSCPKIPVSSEASFEEITQAKTSAQKWMNDDYICHQSILNSLSDQLYDQYSVKTLNAKGLWDELNSFYADDYGTKISHVNNYIQFQMVDGVSVLEQVQELHRIASVITSSGIHIDEIFHAGIIISKLPPSWKHVRAKLLQEEYLPLDKLIYILKDEEDSRNQQKRENGSGWKKKDTRVLCFGCHMEGHIRRDCPLTNR